MIFIKDAIKKILIERLRRPSVVISLTSQFLFPLLLTIGIRMDEQAFMTAVTVICSILVSLGILSNPDTENKGFADDIMICKNCGKHTQHVRAGNKMLCKECGTASLDLTQ